jgi:MFS family permease
VVSCRALVGEGAFAAWGWRIPFLLSAVLVVFSVQLRLKLHESPEFVKMKSSGTDSKAPVRDTLANPRSLALILLTLFGVTAGLGVAWYTSQFYALYFLQSVLKMDFLDANICVAVALVLGTPFFVLFGWLSDRYGRLVFITWGLALSALSFFPLYSWMRAAAETGGYVQIVLAVLVQLVLTAMVYGPTGAYLTELFPPQIRYTGLSVSYHVGTGVFGGFTPLIALSLTTGTGHQLAGLIYPIAITAVAALVGAVLLRGGRHNPTVERAWAQFAAVPVGTPEPVRS